MTDEHEEIEVIDVTLNDEEIDEVIAHLTELKAHKNNVQFPLASDLDLSVTYTEEKAPEVKVEGAAVEDSSKMEEVKSG